MHRPVHPRLITPLVVTLLLATGRDRHARDPMGRSLASSPPGRQENIVIFRIYG
jgi:hypothetical protein